MAAFALGELGDHEAVQPLLDALGDQQEKVQVRKAAAEALGTINDSQAVEPLIEALLEDGSSDFFEAVAEALGKLKDARAVPPLRKALEEPHWGWRIPAIQALGQIAAPEALDSLIKALSDREGWVRSNAVAALAKIGDPRAVDPLMDALNDTEPEVRAAAARALGAMKEGRALQPLLDSLDDEVEDVRNVAAFSLAEIWANTTFEDPTPKLLEVIHKVPRSGTIQVFNALSRRWPGRKNQVVIEAQKLQRYITENAMSKGGDTIIQSGTFHGPTAGKVEGDFICNDPQILVQAIATLRVALQEPGVVSGASNDEVVDKLNELVETFREGGKLEKAKKAWAWLQNVVNVAALPVVASQAWQVLQTAFF